MTPPPDELAFLRSLVGNWTYETEIDANADNPASTDRGTETGRSIDDMWFVMQGSDVSSTGTKNNTMLTLGYNHTRKKMVGTFVSTMMDTIWMYEGDFDPSTNSAILFSEGPSFTGDGSIGQYKDIIEMRTSDHRVFTSQFLTADGSWKEFMTMHYHRVSQ